VNIQNLINKFEEQTISKQELGMLRRAVLSDLLDSIKDLKTEAAIHEWLDAKKSKLNTSKLADSVGYGCKPVNIRQSFKTLVSDCEDELKKAGMITSEAKSNVEKHEEESSQFLAFIQDRLENPDYEWPKNMRGGLYRKAIWAFYLDIPIDEIKYVSDLLTRNIEIKNKLAEIDVLISNNEIKSLDYSSNSAIDEMSETYLSHALSSMRQKLKEKSEEVVFLRHEVNRLEQTISEYENKAKALQASDITAFKKGSAH